MPNDQRIITNTLRIEGFPQLTVAPRLCPAGEHFAPDGEVRQQQLQAQGPKHHHQHRGVQVVSHCLGQQGQRLHRTLFLQ